MGRVKIMAHTYMVVVAELLIHESAPKGIVCILPPKFVDSIDIRGRPLFWSDKRTALIHGVLVGFSEGPLVAVWYPMSSTLGTIEPILERIIQGKKDGRHTARWIYDSIFACN